MLMSLRSAAVLAAALLIPQLTLAADVDTLSVEAPYVRAVPPGQPNSAAFMTLTNTGEVPLALVAAESDAAATVELHTHSMADGMMQMRKIERIDLPPAERVELKPGGLHVMLIGLDEQLKPGMEVALTLILDDDSRIPLTAPVRRIDGKMHSDMAH
jgi:copper(I)-binding protein